MLVALAGGIIWYNSKKANELAVAAAERMMLEAGEDVLNRIKLLYDPMYAIVGIASLVPELTSPAIADNPHAMSLILRVLRIYPQILSFYVGFEDGAFLMVTHLAGENATDLRTALQAPANAAFAVEIITSNAGGERSTRWLFLGEDGSVVGRGPGRTMVSVVVGKLVTHSTIVVRQQVARVEVGAASRDSVIVLPEGAQLQLRARAVDARGYPISGIEPAWHIDDNSVASLDSSGLLTGKVAGRTPPTVERMRQVPRLVSGFTFRASVRRTKKLFFPPSSR